MDAKKDELLSINDEPTGGQLRHFADLINALLKAEKAIERVEFAALPEYHLLISGAGGCGFSCRDIDLDTASEIWNRFATNHDDISKASLVKIRYVVHFLIRNEDHTNSGGPNGGGWILDVTKSGLLKAISDRLETWSGS